MNQRLLNTLCLAGLLLLGLVSCKKDDEEEATLPSLYGVTFNLPPFGRVGETFTMVPGGVYTSEGTLPDDLYYMWKLDDGERQTSDTFTLIAAQTGTYTIACTAGGTGFYQVTATKSIQIIDPTMGETVAENGIDPAEDHLTDPRDADGENGYYTTVSGGLEWFRNNLAYTGSGVAYAESEVTSYPLGRYYTWEEAREACPEGWRLPTTREWESWGSQAGRWMVDALFNEVRMWDYQPAVKISNETRLSVIPAGYALRGGNSPFYRGVLEYAGFWTADSHPDDNTMARYVYLYVDRPEVQYTYGDKQSLGLSVRCVR